MVMKNKSSCRPFGEIALSRNYITLDQLLFALNTQNMEDTEKGEHKLIGTILYEQGALEQKQYAELVNYSWFSRANADT